MAAATRKVLLAVPAVVLALAVTASPADGAPASWGWPLWPRPVVVHPFDAPAWPYAPGHRGVDLAGLAGSSVRTAGAGVVAFAGPVAGRGVVSIDHPGGLRTTYEPVAASVRRGDPVTVGAVIGRLELPDSHCFPAACLHWGLRRGSTYLDPLSLLGAVRVRLLPVWSADAPPVAVRGDRASEAAHTTGGARVVETGAPSGPARSRPGDESPYVPAGLALFGGAAAAMWLGRRRVPP